MSNEIKPIEGRLAEFKGVEPKAGIKTTEFWVSLITALAGVAVSLGLITTGQADSIGGAAGTIAGGVVAAAAAFGYNLSRGKAKGGG